MSSSGSGSAYGPQVVAIYGPEGDQIDNSYRASLVAAFFGETALTRAGVTWRIVLLIVFLGALAALLIAEIL
jgi:hypothetical protein